MTGAALRQPLIGLAVLGALLLAAGFASPWLVPDADRGDLVTRRTARVAVLFWWLAAAALLLCRRDFARAAWAVGAVAFLVHVITAFDEVHGFSHAAAYQHVEVISGFGAGIFVSYAFTVVWAADATWWLMDRVGYDSRPTWLDRLLHGFLAFVVFNGTVIYETGFIRWTGVICFSLLGVLLLARVRGRFVIRQ
jgi:hypothetical protein